MLLVDAADALAGDVRVNLCGGEVAVAEHGLDAARVRAVFEQVRGEAVAQDVGRDAFDARLLSRALEHRPDVLARERPAEVADEEVRRLAPREQLAPRRLVAQQPRDGGAPDGHAPLLAPLPRT